jgi:hypothetical protein
MNQFIDLLNGDQAFELGKFSGKHHKCFQKSGAAGGHLTYTITPTGLGIIYGCKCNICGKEVILNTDDLG